MYYYLRLLLLSLLLISSSSASAGESAGDSKLIPEIVGTFDNVEINREEIQVYLLDSFIAPDQGKEILSTFIQRFMLLRKADELGVKVTATAVRAKYNEMEGESGGRDAMREEIKNSPRSWYQLDAAVEEMLLIENVVRKMEGISPEDPIPAELIRSVFEELNNEYSPQINGMRRKPTAVVATVAGIDLTAADVLAFIVQCAIPEKISAPVAVLINDKMTIHEAEKNEMLPTSLDIEKVISQVREQIAIQNRNRPSTVHLTLGGLLESQGRSLEEFKGSLPVRAEAARMKILTGELNDEALASEYENTKADFRIIKCSHLLLAFDHERPYKPKDVTKSQKQDVRKKIEEIDLLLHQEKDYPGVSAEFFEELVKSYSSCPSRAWKGNIGFTANNPALTKFLPPMAYNLDYLHDDANRAYSPINSRFAYLVPDFLATVNALKDGEVSPPMETAYGYHLFRRYEARYPAHWQLIRRLLYERRRQRLSAALSQRLAEKYPVKYYWGILQKQDEN